MTDRRDGLTWGTDLMDRCDGPAWWTDVTDRPDGPKWQNDLTDRREPIKYFVYVNICFSFRWRGKPLGFLQGPPKVQLNGHIEQSMETSDLDIYCLKQVLDPSYYQLFAFTFFSLYSLQFIIHYFLFCNVSNVFKKIVPPPMPPCTVPLVVCQHHTSFFL